MLLFRELVQQEQRRQFNQDLRAKRKRLRAEMNINMLSEDRFIELFRINKALFQLLYERLTPHLAEPRYQSGVTPRQKILVALRYYASGCYQRSIGEDFHLGVSQTSAHRQYKNNFNEIEMMNLNFLGIFMRSPMP